MTRWSSSSMRPEFRTVDGVTIRFAQSSRHELQALLLSPWPESLLAYQQIWEELSDHAQLAAIDLPGFGASERTDRLLSPSEMGEFIIAVADAFDFDRPHVVGPSVATSASLFAAARHPNRVATVTIGPGPALLPLAVGPELRKWTVPAAADAIGDSTRPRAYVIELLSHRRHDSLADDVRDDYIRSYDGDRLAGTRIYLRRLVEELPELHDLLPTIQAPVQIIAGHHDHLIPWRNAAFLHERIPNSRLSGVDAGHFVWEEAAREYSKLVHRWWRSPNSP